MQINQLFISLIISSAILLLLTSCSQEDFETKLNNLPQKPTLETQELFRLSSPEDYSFFQYIRKIHILSDGNLVVQNYPDHKLYELTPDGELVNVIGRKGRGPGEFIETYISFLTHNDSLHVYDFNNSRHQVLTKNVDGKWQSNRERVFRKLNLEGMVEQVPEKFVLGSDEDYYGIFRIFPTFRDTLNAHYAYVAKVDHNIEHTGKVSRLRLEEDLATKRGDNSSLTVINNRRFYKVFYEYHPKTNKVILIKNNSNEIVSIDSLNDESIIGFLPYERFQRDEEKLEESLRSLNQNYSEMVEITKDKLLAHEPYYWNVILQEDQMWINIARSDTTKPNWIITTLDGKVIENFHGPRKLRSATVHGNYLYGSVTDANGEVFLVGYLLRDL